MMLAVAGPRPTRTKDVSTMTVDNIEDFEALEPFFRVIQEGLAGLVDGSHFFDLLADDVVFEFIITVPDYPRLVAGREHLIELYRGYQSTFFLDRCFDLRVHRADDSTVTLEYASEGKVVRTGRPYGNRYISVVTIKDRKIVHWRDYLDPLRVFAALEGVGDAGTDQA
jgi:ketosteroid isomerase-like protein